MNVITFEECLEILKCKKSKLFDLIHKGKIPATKIGRSWIFIESDIHQYLRDEINRTQRLKEEQQQLREILTQRIFDEFPSIRRKRGRPRMYYPDIEEFLKRK